MSGHLYLIRSFLQYTLQIKFHEFGEIESDATVLTLLKDWLITHIAFKHFINV